MTAKEAAEIANKAQSYQLQKTLERIKKAAAYGDRQLVLDDNTIRLFEADYKKLEDLGYTVKKGNERHDEKGIFWVYFDVITW